MINFSQKEDKPTEKGGFELATTTPKSTMP
jgi:hypothetical protein